MPDIPLAEDVIHNLQKPACLYEGGFFVEKITRHRHPHPLTIELSCLLEAKEMISRKWAQRVTRGKSYYKWPFLIFIVQCLV